MGMREANLSDVVREKPAGRSAIGCLCVGCVMLLGGVLVRGETEVLERFGELVDAVDGETGLFVPDLCGGRDDSVGVDDLVSDSPRWIEVDAAVGAVVMKFVISEDLSCQARIVER